MMKTLVLASAIAIGALAACTEQGAGPTDPQASTPTPDGQVQPAAVPTVQGNINWDAARADFAKRPAGTENVSVQSVGKDGPSPVPMLLPSGIASAQGAGGDRPSPPVVTADGYFATYHLPKYDAIVNGSMTAHPAPGQTAGDKSAMKFTTGEASAQLSFSRYGADYLIEFECKEVDSSNGCITEAEAKEFATSLFVAQTR
jgi:hypothetical protein